MPPSRQFRINFIGDVMLGRLIDQLMPTHVPALESSEAEIIASMRATSASLRSYGARSPWGNTLPLFESAGLNIANLETAVTTHPRPWPAKVFNFRMHPANVAALRAARIDHVNLANNHVLDYCEDGLRETLATLDHAGIRFAGAGNTRAEALSPAVLTLPRSISERSASNDEPPPSEGNGAKGEEDKHKVYIWGASDHPECWSHIPGLHLIRYDDETKKSLKEILTSTPQPQGSSHEGAGLAQPPAAPPSLKIFSIHWGPNYGWEPDTEIRDLGHFLVDECGVDIVHGHSSHHVQGAEVYKGRLILWGCGDFVDDYAVRAAYRNDLAALWRVTVAERPLAGEPGKGGNTGSSRLGLQKLEIFPTRIKLFQTGLLKPGDEDHEWVRSKLTMLCRNMGTRVNRELGDQGQLVIDIDPPKSPDYVQV